MKLLTLTEDKSYRAAVAVIRNGDKWLLGLAKNTGDDRSNRWVFPGGSIKPGESPERAACREAKEESGVRCRAISDAIEDNKPGVAFIACKTNDSKKESLKPNHEFAMLGWFTVKEMKSLKLYNNVLRLIDKAKKYN